MPLDPGIAPKGEPQSFAEYLLQVNPTKTALENLADQPDDTPIIMLNLLRFRPRGDPYIYSLYGKDAGPEVAKTKSYVGFFGMTIRDLDPAFGLSTDWDGIVLPIYRSRSAFLALQRSPIYQRAIPLRTAGTFSRLLYVMKDAANSRAKNLTATSISIQSLNQSRMPILAAEQDCILIELFRLRPGKSATMLQEFTSIQRQAMAMFDGELLLQPNAEVPIVTEDLWDFCQISGFPSQGALASYLASPQVKELTKLRKDLFTNSLHVAGTAAPIPS